ncbi:TetR/AcrR family transcriptional regulator [Fulvivirga ligni]|uniref:TetR/AcrR family transcriptional regulator n=1 Tax=Fulvivirga ligni TaxID=2904246 RepID=UPI001F2F14FB|nr:TetR/AcrR family transcriptional regulator [Fulvivirga ligni]UII19565.1 TetR/AcrR family transcriptional regulator [Fulvivirga ligni]
MKEITDTEIKIINAARKVFFEKGFKGATMREIAAEAGGNLSMVNYYFRSKENLFYLINDETFTTLLSKVSQCILREESIEEKITGIVNEYTDFFMLNPQIPSFISGEIIRNPKKIAALIKEKVSESNIHKDFEVKLRQHVEAGVFKPGTNILQIFINIISLTVFPIISQPIIQESYGLSSEDYKQFVLNRKVEISNMIIQSIKA